MQKKNRPVDFNRENGFITGSHFKRYFSIVFSIALLLSSVLQAQNIKRLYIANDDHTDYMWAANEAQYDSAFVHMLDYYLHQVDSTQNNAPDFQARFNCDASYWLRAYEKYRSPAQFNHLMSRIKSGHISSPLNLLVNCYGAQPTEAVLRGMYYAGSLERRFGLRFTLATAMENNTLPLGLASLWAGSGAKYSWKGIGGYGSQMSYEMRATRKYQMYQYTGLDSSKLIMKWYAFNGKKFGAFGGYAECRNNTKSSETEKQILQGINKLDIFCDTISHQLKYPFNVAGAFGWGHDDIASYVSQPFIDAARNGTNASRKVRVSNEVDFFEDVERNYPNLPSQAVSYGNEWDLLCASMNETTAKVRRATEKLRSAEALAAIVSIKDKSIMHGLAEARNRAWETFGMYWEHNWTADGPVPRKDRAAWQIKLQQQLTNYVDTLFNRSLTTLGTQIKKSGASSFYVFNPLSWIRNDVADIIYDGNYPVKVIDELTQNEVASQLVLKDRKQFLRILAENIPPVGYKVFKIIKGVPMSLSSAAKLRGDYFSNALYRIRLSPSGAITELYDSMAGCRQLVIATNGKYMNDLGSRDISDGDRLMLENEGPVSVTVKAVSHDPVLHTVRLTLFRNTSRIEIEDSIQENFGGIRSWAFSFALKGQTTRHEELGAILTSKLVSHGGHYANENARYDYETFNHFADMSERGYGVTLSNMDCSFFKLGNSSVDSLWEQSAQLNALAGGNVDKKKEDGGILGILNQNGQKDFLYKFAITTHQQDFNAVKAMKFSLEHQNPLVTGMVTGITIAETVNSFSLLKISDPNVLLWDVKPAEDGPDKGLIARFWNLDDEKNQPLLSFPRFNSKAWKTSHIETDESVVKQSKQGYQLNFRPGQINTYRILVKSK